VKSIKPLKTNSGLSYLGFERTMYSVLYVDDEPDLLELGKLFLESSGEFAITTAVSAKRGIDLLNSQTFDAIVSDFQMPDMDGITFLRHVRSSLGDIPFILFTGKGREEVVIEAINNGVDFYLQKGGDPLAQFGELAHKIRQAARRKQMEAALSENREYLNQIFSSIQAGIIIVDAKTHEIIDVNPAAAAMIGASRDQIVTKTCHQFICPAERGRCPITDMNQCVDNAERILVTAGGQKIPIIKHVVRATLNGRECLLETFIDNTDRKRIEQELFESEAQYRLVVDNTQDIVYLQRGNRCLFMNPRGLEVLGYSEKEMYSLPIYQHVFPEDLPIVRQLADSWTDPALSSASRTIRVRTKTGETRFFELAVAKITFRGELATLVTAHDISERKQKEDELHAAYEQLTAQEEELRSQLDVLIESQKALSLSEEKFRSIIESIPLGMHFYRLDKEGHLVFSGANPAAETVFPTTVKYPEGKSLETLFPGFQKNGFPAIFRDVALNRISWHSDRVLYEDDYYKGIFAVWAFSVSPENIVITFMDVKEREQMSEALRLANRKMRLLSDITRHDITNKLSIISGYIELAGSAENTEDIREYIRKIQDAAATIRSQLDFARDYQTLGSAAPQWQDVTTLITLARTSHDPGSTGFVLPVQNLEIFADPLMEKVFYNLVDNALRYGKTLTKIQVSYEQVPEGLRIVIEDDGIGISPENKEKIFERGFGNNTGFGLFLTREILSITGITICETGEYQKGARFEILIPPGAFRMNPLKNASSL